MQYWYIGIFKLKLCKPLKNYPDRYKQVIHPEFISKQIWVGETKLIMWKIIRPVSKSTNLWNPVPGIPSGHHSLAIFLASNEGLCTTDTAFFPKQDFYSVHIVNSERTRRITNPQIPFSLISKAEWTKVVQDNGQRIFSTTVTVCSEWLRKTFDLLAWANFPNR